MQSNKIYLVMFILILVVFGINLYSHGLSVNIIKSGEIAVIKAAYHGGKLITNARVDIFYQNGKHFQKGRTDKNGLFCFKPDLTGNYKIVVDDEMGHKKSINMDISEDFLKDNVTNIMSVQKKTGQIKPIEKPLIKNDKENHNDIFKILFGITLILLITLILFLLKKNK